MRGPNVMTLHVWGTWVDSERYVHVVPRAAATVRWYLTARYNHIQVNLGT